MLSHELLVNERVQVKACRFRNCADCMRASAQSTGIISDAIANAEKLGSFKAQENTSLLHQPQSARSTPASTQFTFTCDSQVPGSLAWPGSDPKMSASASSDYDIPVRSYPHSRIGFSHQSATPGTSPQAGVPSDSSLQGEAPQSEASERRNRRRAARDLHIQARKRREDTARQNYFHPQRSEDLWICEFCEYERIFGYPPVALIRQYEIKDRKIRQQEEERRRVWEKAKARSRKGKKGKMLPKNSNTNHHVHSHVNEAHHAPPLANTHSQDTQSEVFDDDDEYEGEGSYEFDSEPPMLVPADKKHVGVFNDSPEGGTGGGGGERARGLSLERDNN